MEVQLYATLRAVARRRTIEVEAAADLTAERLLAIIVERYPDAAFYLFDEEGTLLPNVHLLVDGREVRYLPGGLATVLRADQRIDLFPAVGGG